MKDVLLVIDVQQALLDELPPGRRAQLVTALVPLLDRARAAGIPVVYVRHDGSPAELIPGTPGWEIAPEIVPRSGETIIDKRTGDAFVQTALADVLAALDADHVIATGMQTDVCVRATIGGAIERGYRVTLVADAHATSSTPEEERRDALHEETRASGARVLAAADIFG